MFCCIILPQKLLFFILLEAKSKKGLSINASGRFDLAEFFLYICMCQSIAKICREALPPKVSGVQQINPFVGISFWYADVN